MNENYALIEDGVVVNTIVWDGDAKTWAPPEGVIAIPISPGEPVSIGWSYKDPTFLAPS